MLAFLLKFVQSKSNERNPMFLNPVCLRLQRCPYSPHVPRKFIQSFAPVGFVDGVLLF